LFLPVFTWYTRSSAMCSLSVSCLRQTNDSEYCAVWKRGLAKSTLDAPFRGMLRFIEADGLGMLKPLPFFATIFPSCCGVNIDGSEELTTGWKGFAEKFGESTLVEELCIIPIFASHVYA
jgi:hypothetical protein